PANQRDAARGAERARSRAIGPREATTSGHRREPPPSSDDAGTTRRSEERTERSGPAPVRTATHAIQTDTQRPKPVTSDPAPGRPTEKSRQIARVHSGKFACRYLETVADPAVGR